MPEIETGATEIQTAQTSDAPQAQATPEITAPVQFYTPEELGQTHFSEIDANRLPEQVRAYLPVVQQRLAYLEAELAKAQGMSAQASQAQRQLQMQQIAANAPKEYTPQEIVNLAKERTAQQLGVKSEELDFYDPQVMAMLPLNAQKISQERANEIQNYHARAQARVDFDNLNNALRSQPDFQQFDAYLTQMLAAKGVTATTVTDYINKTGDYNGLRNAILEAYQGYTAAKQAQVAQAQAQVTPKPAVQNAKPRVPAKVPFIEPAGTTPTSQRKRLDMKNFGNMSEDQRMQALIDMGLCEVN